MRFNAFIGGYRDIPGLFTETTRADDRGIGRSVSSLPATPSLHTRAHTPRPRRNLAHPVCVPVYVRVASASEGGREGIAIPITIDRETSSRARGCSPTGIPRERNLGSREYNAKRTISERERERERCSPKEYRTVSRKGFPIIVRDSPIAEASVRDNETEISPKLTMRIPGNRRVPRIFPRGDGTRCLLARTILPRA